MNILFTCAGRRNYLINYFKEILKGKGLVIAADLSITAPALTDADIGIQVPPIYDSSYIQALVNIVERHNIDALISLNDLELPVLSKQKAILEEKGCKVLVSDQACIDIAFDKWRTYKFLKEIGINTPKTYLTLSEALEGIESGELQFPLVLKPRWGSASVGIEFPLSNDELELSYRLLNTKISRSILGEASKQDISRAIIIQEKLEGVEYGMDILNTFEGEYYGSFARKKLAMRSGETDKAKSVALPGLIAVGRLLGTKFKHIGNLDCDLFLVNDKAYVLEFNPRFGGGYPFSHEAGINMAGIYVSWLEGCTEVDKYNQYKQGLAFAKCDRLIEIKDI